MRKKKPKKIVELLHRCCCYVFTRFIIISFIFVVSISNCNFHYLIESVVEAFSKGWTTETSINITEKHFDFYSNEGAKNKTFSQSLKIYERTSNTILFSITIWIANGIYRFAIFINIPTSNIDYYPALICFNLITLLFFYKVFVNFIFFFFDIPKWRWKFAC